MNSLRRYGALLCALLLLLCCFAVTPVKAASLTLTGVDEVLIYNPYIWESHYDEAQGKWVETDTTLSTGNLRDQIQITATDAVEGETFRYYEPRLALGKRTFETSRSYGVNSITSYTVGSTRTLWVCTNLTSNSYGPRSFTLLAVGEHCLCWALLSDSNAPTTAQAEAYVREFDSVIYPSDTANFGDFLDLEGTGKVDLIFYKMSSSSVCGFFDPYDLYTAAQIALIDPDNAEEYNSIAAIYVNSSLLGETDVVYSTLAHEFQHLINFSATLSAPANAASTGTETEMNAWLNEALSMAAEELAYPGEVEEQKYLSGYGGYNNSNLIRKGQSLYNFNTGSYDIGVYGQGFLFTEFLKAQTDAGVFRRMIALWRSTATADKLNDGALLGGVLSAFTKSQLDALVDYGTGLEATLGEDGTLLSKLNLAFHIAVIEQADTGLFSIGSAVEDASMPLFTGGSTVISGGGAVRVKLSGNSFTVPTGAGEGLVYVGFLSGKLISVNGESVTLPQATATPTPTNTPAPTATPTATPPSILYGDVNLDGSITSADAALLLRWTVKLSELTNEQLLRADADRSGGTPTASDAATILRHTVKLEKIRQDG